MPQGIGSALTDTLHVATPTLEQKEAPTKCKIASDVAHTFDLMGWFSPCTVTLKILLQSLWKLQLGWDDEVPDHIARTWREWRDELPLITAQPIPRYNFDLGKKARSLQLHSFSDASDLAYAGVVYLRAVYEDATASLTLVIAKTPESRHSLSQPLHDWNYVEPSSTVSCYS